MIKKYRILMLLAIVASLIVVACDKNDDEDDITGNPPAAPLVNNPLHVYGNYFYVNWTGVVGAEGYVVDVATDQAFTSILSEYNNKEVEINGMFVVDNLDISTTYYVRMRAFNAEGNSGNSAVQQFITRESNMLPNGNMQDWIDYTHYMNPSPEGVWASANKTVDLNPAYYPAVLFRTDTAYSGNYAAKAVTAKVDGLPLLTGSLSTGLFHVDLNDPLNSMIIGVPYKSRPTRFQGWYMYTGVDSDSLEIRTTLTRWDPLAKQQLKIGEAVMIDAEQKDQYTFFDLEFIYFSNEEPDTIDMVFAASTNGENFIGGIGSTLFVDDFDLIFE